MHPLIIIKRSILISDTNEIDTQTKRIYGSDIVL